MHLSQGLGFHGDSVRNTSHMDTGVPLLDIRPDVYYSTMYRNLACPYVKVVCRVRGI